jgi:hypothetical protein
MTTSRLGLRWALAVLGLAASLSVVAGPWFGQAPEDDIEPMAVGELMHSPDEWLGESVAVAGRVTDVCTNRGCWAVLEGGGRMVRIVARDHGFVIPESARGSATAYGVLERRELSDEAARHMVEDDGADPSLLADPVEYRLVAEGVSIEG